MLMKNDLDGVSYDRDLLQSGLLYGLALSDELQSIFAFSAEAANKANRDAKFFSYVFALAFLYQPSVRYAHKFTNIELVQLSPAIFVAQSALIWLNLFLFLCKDFLPILLHSRIQKIIVYRWWQQWHFSRVTKRHYCTNTHLRVLSQSDDLLSELLNLLFRKPVIAWVL